jgi:hypothetical protein
LIVSLTNFTCPAAVVGVIGTSVPRSSTVNSPSAASVKVTPSGDVSIS